MPKVLRWKGGEVEKVERWKKWNEKGGKVQRWKGGTVKRWKGGKVKRWKGEQVKWWKGGRVQK